MNDTLATLNRLVEAGADEAIADQPVNRMAAPKPAAPPAATVRPQTQPVAPRRAEPPPLPLEGDAIGGAMAAAGAANSLAELRAAMEAFEGCALKRTAN